MPILEELFDSKKLAVIKIFMKEKSHEFYLREISQKSKVPVATTFRIVNRLVSLRLVDMLAISKFKAYRWASNKNTKYLQEIIEKEVQNVKK